MAKVKVKVKSTTKEVVKITLTKMEAQALSDLLSGGVVYHSLDDIGLCPLNSQLADLFPEIQFNFDVLARIRA